MIFLLHLNIKKKDMDKNYLDWLYKKLDDISEMMLENSLEYEELEIAFDDLCFKIELAELLMSNDILN